ncbi:MAG: hypothetical protein CVU97_02565 [Firmicutes bacterium HGW-Firmicutes-21]|nr:MAG: hypothetical protein CVU97_02565 [Firmicutes bacterium HGW-Firmicutes-21]
MEKLAKQIAENIGQNFKYDYERIAVISYGLTAIFQMLIIFSVVSVLGILGGFWVEGMIIFLLVGFLRRSVGGAHSNTFTGCLIISIFFITLMALLSHYLSNPDLVYLYSAFSAVVFIWSFYIIYKKAPVDSTKKPITKPEKIRRLRINAFITLFIYGFAVAALYFVSDRQLFHSGYGIGITMAVLWQTTMLTGPGHKFIQLIDYKLVDF